MNAPSSMPSAARLAPQDITRHEALGIDAEILQLAHVRRVGDLEGRELLGLTGRAGNMAGIEYPYLDPVTGRRTTLRVRVDCPPVKVDGTPEKKYRQPYGDQRHLYFAPGAGASLDRPTVPVVIVESEKAALAVASAAKRADRDVLAIALGGCWNWKGRIGKDTDANGARVDVHGPLPDFHRVAWTPDRPTFIAFDARPNHSVQAARRELARFLRSIGARVLHIHLPEQDARVNGPDDLIGVEGDGAFWRVMDAATPDDFTRTPKGDVVASDLDNIRLALTLLGARVTFDAFARQACLCGVPLDDTDVERLWVRINDEYRFRPSRETLRTVLITEADAHQTHPVREYLAGLRWDGQPRLDDWLVTYGGATDSPYVRAVGALPLKAAVRRVRQPGAKFDELLILESAQGTLKSSALRNLCPDESWFSDDLPLGVDSKQIIERTAGKWIIEAAELHGNRGREAEALKAFLSRQVDGPVRLAYGRLPTTVPRQFILIGTTNARLGYLKDMTGARRFWPVTVAGFDVEALKRDRDQIWAEAVARDDAGESIRLDAALWAEAAAQQEDRRASDPWEEKLEALFDSDAITRTDCVPVEDVWAALGAAVNQRDTRASDRINAIVQRFGFTKARRRLDGRNVRCWVREDAS